MLLLGGLYLGLLEGNVSWLATLPGDVVVSEEAAPLVTTLLQTSRLPDTAVRAVAAVEGVGRIERLHGRLVSLEESRDRYTLVYLVGLRPTQDFAAPVAIVAGRGRPRLGEIVVDRVLAHDLHVGLGNAVRVGQASLRVAGIAQGGNAVLGTYAFVHRGALELAGFEEPAYLFVGTAPGVDPGALADRIDALPGVRAVTRARFLAQRQAPFRQMMLPVVALVVALGAAVAAAVVGVSLYTATVERRAEHGLLDALGLPRRRLYGLVLYESAIVTALGLALGVGAARIAAGALTAWEPRFLTVMPLGLAAAVLLGGAVVALGAALLPMRALGRLDPALVFRV